MFLQKNSFVVVVMEDEKKTRETTMPNEHRSSHSFNVFHLKFSKTEESDGRRKEEEKQQCEENPKMVQITNSIESYS